MKDPAFLFYPNDWQGGTMTLGRYTKGCYMDLLTAQFNTGHLSAAEIKTVLGQDFGQQWPILSKKFLKDGNGLYYNERLDNEIKKRKTFSEKQKLNGLKGGRPKKPNNNPPVTPNESLLENGNEIENENLKPEEYLQKNIAAHLEQLQLNTGLPPQEFGFCLTQWSLKVEEQGWQYSDQPAADLKRLRAGFEKWLNSWMKNLQTGKIEPHDKPATKRKGHDIEAVTNAAEEFLSHRYGQNG